MDNSSARTNSYVVTGMLTNDHTVTLDEPLPLSPMKVRIMIEPLQPQSQRPFLGIITSIRQRQHARGHRPPTREDVDAYLLAERNSWGE